LANNPASQCSLGAILVQQKDDAKANDRGVDLLKKSAATEYPEAQHELALCQLRGIVVPKDEKSAVELLKRSADSGFAPSQCELGDCFANGVGVEKDLKQAEPWYLKAVQSDVVNAQLGLGRVYQEMKDFDKSIEWFEKAYYNGHKAEAAQSLRRIFSPENKTVASNLEKATEWAYRARDFHFTSFFLEDHADAKTLVPTIKGLYRTSIHDKLNRLTSASYTNLTNHCEVELRSPLFRRAALHGCPVAALSYSHRLPEQDPRRVKYIRIAPKGERSLPLLRNGDWG
jgi:tetratricopeptide (TPR) repeat protein